MLEILLRNLGGLVTKQRLAQLLSESNTPATGNAVDIVIHRLRKRLEPLGLNLRTIRGLAFLRKLSSIYSIRTTLLLWLLTPLVVLVLLSTVLANHFAEGFANRSFDSFLLNSTDSIAARVHMGPNGVAITELPAASRDLFGHNGKDRFFYQVVDKNRQTFRSCVPSFARSADVPNLNIF